jgi:methylated-DNA-[protein]-cysteine S-methyltransferase
MSLIARSIATPLGEMLALVNAEGALVALPFVDDTPEAIAARAAGQDTRIVWKQDGASAVARQLEEYFNRRRTTFDLLLRPRGSAFQHAVWRELSRIPYGVTTSYAELARAVGRAGAARAIGRANATNPIPVVVPCHRVIGARGALTGYGGGMARKEYLLAHEGAISEALPQPASAHPPRSFRISSVSRGKTSWSSPTMP